MNEKIIVSKKVADSIEWLKESKVSFVKFLKILNDDIINNSQKEINELLKLDKSLIFKILTNGYEIGVPKLENLPDYFKLKHYDNKDTIFYATKFDEIIVISWINEFKEIQSKIHSVNDSISAINLGYWIIVD